MKDYSWEFREVWRRPFAKNSGSQLNDRNPRGKRLLWLKMAHGAWYQISFSWCTRWHILLSCLLAEDKFPYPTTLMCHKCFPLPALHTYCLVSVISSSWSLLDGRYHFRNTIILQSWSVSSTCRVIWSEHLDYDTKIYSRIASAFASLLILSITISVDVKCVRVKCSDTCTSCETVLQFSRPQIRPDHRQ